MSEKTCLTLLTRLPHLLGRYFHSRLSCLLFVHPAQALLNSSPQLLARDRRAVARSAELGPGDLRMDAAAYAAVSGRGSVNCRARVRGSASRKRAGHIMGNIPLEISGITITTNLAGVDRAKGDEVKSSTANARARPKQKRTAASEFKKREKMWPGTESNCRHEDFQSSCRTETMCHYRSLLVSIQAFNGGLSRSILPIRTHRDI